MQAPSTGCCVIVLSVPAGAENVEPCDTFRGQLPITVQSALAKQPPSDRDTVIGDVPGSGQATFVTSHPPVHVLQHLLEVCVLAVPSRPIIRRLTEPPHHPQHLKGTHPIRGHSAAAVLDASGIHPAAQLQPIRGDEPVRHEHVTMVPPILIQRGDTRRPRGGIVTHHPYETQRNEFRPQPFRVRGTAGPLPPTRLHPRAEREPVLGPKRVRHQPMAGRRPERSERRNTGRPVCYRPAHPDTLQQLHPLGRQRASCEKRTLPMQPHPKTLPLLRPERPGNIGVATSAPETLERRKGRIPSLFYLHDTSHPPILASTTA